MKVLLFLTLLVSSLVRAQVNLDRAYLGKTGNTLFYDLNDPNTIWAIPPHLEATSLDDVVKVGSEYRVRYSVSLPQQTVLDLIPPENSPLTFRAFRATQFSLEQLTDVDPRLKPHIIPLGDMGMFGEKIPYTITLQAKHYPHLAKKTAYHLLNGKHMLLLGRVIYYFSAARSGQLFQAQSVVGILAPKIKVTTPLQKAKLTTHALNHKANPEIDEAWHQLEEMLEVLKSGSPSTPNPLHVVSNSLGNYAPQILFQSQTACWDKGMENVICLKDQ